MAKIEERVLSMKFDNRQFKASAADTLQTLEKLKSSLNMDNIKSGLSKAFGHKMFDGVRPAAESAVNSFKMVNDAANNVDLTRIEPQIQTVKNGFSALQIVGIGALASIGAKAAEVGMNVVKSFTLEPIMDGFREYETKIDAIGRIKANTASKGTTMDEITSTLDELNKYSDKTVYNFGQMTDSIAKFTTAGVDVKTAATSIKGLSNLAALSGATAAESANVNRQISQALGSGTVKLQDWMSVENAGMNGEAFKTVLFQVGKMNGTLKTGAETLQEWEKSGKSFRETLQDGWLTTDVLNKSLKIMSNDMSEAEIAAMGFTEEQAKAMKLQSQQAYEAASNIKTFSQLQDTLKEAAGSSWVGVFEAMFGGLEESTKIFTGISNVLTPLITGVPLAISGAFESWGKGGGRTDLIAGLSALGGELQKLFGPVGQAFKDVFGTAGQAGEQMVKVTAAFRKFAESLNISTESGKMLGTIFKGVFTVIKIGLTVVGGLLRVFFMLLGTAIKLVVSVVNALGKSFVAVQSVFSAVGQAIQNFVDALKLAFSIVTGKLKLSDIFKPVGDGAKAANDQVKAMTVGMVGGFDQVSKKLSDIGRNTKSAASQISKMFLTGRFDAGFLEEDSKLISMANRLRTSWAPLSNVIGNVANAFSILFKHDFMDGFGTWTEDDKIVDNLLKVNEAVRDAVEWFGNLENLSPGQILSDIGNTFNHIGQSIKNVDLKAIIVGMFNAIKSIELPNIGDLISSALSKIGELPPIDFSAVYQSIVKMGSSLNNAIRGLVNEIDWGGFGKALVKGLAGAIGAVVALPAAAAFSIGALMEGLFSKDIDISKTKMAMVGAKEEIETQMADVDSALSRGYERIKPPLEAIKKFFSAAGEGIGAAGRVLGKVFGDISQGIKNANIDVDLTRLSQKIAEADLPTLLTSVGLAFGGAGFVGMARTLKSLGTGLGDVMSGIGEGAENAGKGLKALGDAKKISARAEALEAFGTAALKVAVAVAIMVAALYVLSKIDTDSLIRGFAALAGVILLLAAAMLVMSKIDFGGDDFEWDPKKGKLANILGGLNEMVKTASKGVLLAGMGIALIGLAAAVAILVKSMKDLGEMSWGEIAKGLVGVGLALAGLTIAIKMMPEQGVLKASAAMLLIAFALSKMVEVIRDMGALSWTEIVKGLVGVAGSIGILVVATNMMDPNKVDKLGASLVKIGLAFTLMAFAFKTFGALKFGELAKGFLVMGAALMFLAGVSKFVKTETLAVMGTQLLILSAALLVMAFAMTKISQIPFEVLATGILKTAVMLGAMALALKIMPERDIMKSSASILVLSAALVALSVAIRIMGTVDTSSVLASAFAIGVMVGVMVLMGSMSGMMLKASGTMLLMAAGIGALALAFGLLIPVLMGLGSLSFETIGKGLLTIAGVLLIMVGFSYLMAPVIVVLLGFAAAIALIGAAALLFAAGAALISASLAAIAVSGVAAAAVLPILAAAFASAIVAFAAVLASGAPIIGNSVYLILTALGEALLKTIQDLGPILIETIVILVLALVDAIAAAVPQIVDSFMMMLTGIINAIAERTPELIAAFVNLLNALATSIEENQEPIRSAMSRLIISLISIVLGVVGDMIAAGGEVMMGLLSGLSNFWSGTVWPWITSIPSMIMGAFAGAASWLFSTGVNILQGLKDGMVAKFNDVVAWLHEKAASLKDIAANALKIKSPSRVFMELGGYVSEGLALGIRNNNRPARETESLAKGVITQAQDTLEIHSPSKVFEGIGTNVGEGLANGISGQTGNVANATGNLFDTIMRVANDKSLSIGDKIFAVASANPLTTMLAKAGQNAKDDYEKELSDRAKSYDEAEKKLIDEINKAKDGEVKANDNITKSLDKQNKAQAENNKLKSDSSITEANTYSDTSTDVEDTETSAKTTKASHEKEREQHKLEAEQRKIADNREKREKAEEKLRRLRAAKDAYLTGQAIANGTELGLKDSEERVMTVAERYADKIAAEVDRVKKRANEYMDLFKGLRSVGSTFKNITENVREFVRAFKRLNTSTNDKSFMTNLGMMFDALLGIGGELVGLIDLFDKFKPFLTPLLKEFEGKLPQIIDIVKPFAPQVASMLAGGLTAGLPAVVGAAGGLIAAVAAVGVFLYDMGKDKKIVGFVKTLIEQVAEFLKSLPSRIADFIKTLVKGIENTIRGLPDAVKWLVGIIKDVVTGIIKQLPAIIKGLVMAAIDLIVLVFETPGILIDAAVALITGLADALVASVGALVDVAIWLVEEFIEIFTNPRESMFVQAAAKLVGGIVRAIIGLVPKLFEAGVSLVMGLVNGILSFVGKIWELVTAPFRAIIDGVKRFFGIHSPSTVFYNIGTNLLQGLINGIGSFVGTIWNLVKAPFVAIWNGITNLFSGAINVGRKLITDIATGVRNFAGNVISGVKDVAGKIWNGVTSVFSGAINVGKNIIGGIVTGIKNTASTVWNGIKRVGKGIVDGFKWFFGIKSPSRVFIKLAGYLTEGMAVGLEKTADAPVEAMKIISDDMVAQVEAIDPTIRPVIDMSNVEAGIKDMEGALDGADLTGNATITAATILTDQNAMLSSTARKTEEEVKPSETVINYTQNNYSPKELSAIDIYRNTQRQLDYVKMEGSNV